MQDGGQASRSAPVSQGDRRLGHGRHPLRLPAQRGRAIWRQRLFVLPGARGALRQRDETRRHRGQLGPARLLRCRAALAHTRRRHHGGRPRVQCSQLDSAALSRLPHARQLSRRVHTPRPHPSHHRVRLPAAHALERTTRVDERGARQARGGHPQRRQPLRSDVPRDTAAAALGERASWRRARQHVRVRDERAHQHDARRLRTPRRDVRQLHSLLSARAARGVQELGGRASAAPLLVKATCPRPRPSDK